MPSTLTRHWRNLQSKLGLQRDWYLVLMAALIGLIMGGVATAFMRPIQFLESRAEHLGESHHTWNLLLILSVPIVGGLLTGLIVHYIPSDSRGPGVSSVIYSIHRGKSRLPLRTAVRKWLASTATIGSGGSAGPEGPIVTIGAVIGSSVGRLLKTNPQETATLLGCGAAAGIASVFNAPIAGIFFVLEVLLRDFSLRTFTPIVIASVVSSAWTLTMQGNNEPLFGVGPDFIHADDVFQLPDVPNYLLLGLVCGISAPLLVRSLFLAESLFGRIKVNRILRPAIGATALGLLGLIYLLIARPEHNVPPFFGNGYATVKELIDPATYLADVSNKELKPLTTLIVAVLAIVILKSIATCLTIGSGGIGGLFAPSLVIGAGVGGAFGSIVKHFELLPAANPAHYALVGMAAMIAATTHAPLTGILLVYEITRSYSIILPLMLAAVIGTITARLILRDSVYTWKLSRIGIQFGAMSDLTILRRLSVQDVPLSMAVVVHSEDAARKLLDLSEENAVTDFVVVDDNQHYIGMVTGADLRAAMLYHEAVPVLQVAELQRSDLPTVTPDEPLDIVLDKFSRHDVHSLPVLQSSGNGAVVGLITRAMLMQKYQNELSKD